MQGTGSQIGSVESNVPYKINLREERYTSEADLMSEICQRYQHRLDRVDAKLKNYKGFCPAKKQKLLDQKAKYEKIIGGIRGDDKVSDVA